MRESTCLFRAVLLTVWGYTSQAKVAEMMAQDSSDASFMESPAPENDRTATFGELSDLLKEVNQKTTPKRTPNSAARRRDRRRTASPGTLANLMNEIEDSDSDDLVCWMHPMCVRSLCPANTPYQQPDVQCSYSPPDQDPREQQQAPPQLHEWDQEEVGQLPCAIWLPHSR